MKFTLPAFLSLIFVGSSACSQVATNFPSKIRLKVYVPPDTNAVIENNLKCENTNEGRVCWANLRVMPMQMNMNMQNGMMYNPSGMNNQNWMGNQNSMNNQNGMIFSSQRGMMGSSQNGVMQQQDPLIMASRLEELLNHKLKLEERIARLRTAIKSAPVRMKKKKTALLRRLNEQLVRIKEEILLVEAGRAPRPASSFDSQYGRRSDRNRFSSNAMRGSQDGYFHSGHPTAVLSDLRSGPSADKFGSNSYNWNYVGSQQPGFPGF